MDETDRMTDGGMSQSEDNVWLLFSGDSLPSYIVQSFLNDCLAYPKIILHKEFEFFRQCLSSVGVNITCNNGIYHENHCDPTFCVELEKRLLSDILHREDYLPHEGAWSSVSRLQIKKKLGLGVWKWEMPKGSLDILRLFTSFFQHQFDTLKSDPSMDYFLKFISEFSVDYGADTEEIYIYEKADEERKAKSGYVTPDYSSEEETINKETQDICYIDSSDDDNISVSSVESCDSDFNPKKGYLNPKTSKGKSKIKSKKKLLNRHSSSTSSSVKVKGDYPTVRKPRKMVIIRCIHCDRTFKYRSALLKHEKQSHGTGSPNPNPKTNPKTNPLKRPYCDEEDSDIEVLSVSLGRSESRNSGCKQSVANKVIGRATAASVRYQLREIVNSINFRKSKVIANKITENNINTATKRPRYSSKERFCKAII